MGTPEAIPAPRDLAGLRTWLDDRLLDRGLLRTASADGPAVMKTGWPVVDDELLAGGLKTGAIHEWMSVAAGRSRWLPPLGLLIHLARNALTEKILWVGSRVRPTVAALGTAKLLERSLLIDPADDATRLWAIDAALRCGGCVVIADGSRLSMTDTRRLQLAAEAGQSVGLLARPQADQQALSSAATRWLVMPEVSGDLHPRWRIQLVRGKGRHAMVMHERSFVVEQADEGCVVPVSAAVADRPPAAAVAS